MRGGSPSVNTTATSAAMSMDCVQDQHKEAVTLDPVFLTYYLGCFVVVMVMNLTGNWLVMRTFYRHKCLRLPCNAFVWSLALSDFLFGLAFPFYNVAAIDTPGVRRLFGQWPVCRVIMLEVIALEICSAYALVGITVTRFIGSAFPLRYHRYVTSRNCKVAVFIIWVTSHAASAFGYAVHEPYAVRTGQYDMVCRYETLYTVQEIGTMTVLQFGLPFTIMLIFYLRMACIARKVNTRVASENCASDGSEQFRAMLKQRRQKSFIIITLLTGCFFFSYVPLLVYLFIAMKEPECILRYEYFSATSRIVLFLNTAVNVFIYAGRMSDFRDYLRMDIASLLPSALCCSATSPETSLWTTGMTSRRVEEQEKRVPPVCSHV